MLKRRMSEGRVMRPTSRGGSGRGPTSDMSPRRTFQNCGSSSIDHLRNCRPSGVIRGSFLILKTGPRASFRSSKDAWSRSASATIERNLNIRNGRLLRPHRACA